MKPSSFSLRITTLSFFFFFILCACDNNMGTYEHSATDTGSIAFSVIWNRGPNNSLSVQPRNLNDCTGIDIVEADILSQDNQMLKSGRWPCSAHQGTITGVPIGSNRRLIVLGLNGDDEIVYRGEETGITVTAGETEVVDSIVADYFVPDLLQPENESMVDIGYFSLQWSSVEGVKEYYIAVSEDSGFNSFVFYDTTQNTTYTLTGLSGDKTYYWYVYALDNTDNNGVSTDVWSFTTATEYLWFRDGDEDSYGDPNNSTLSSIQPTGYVADNTDCDDGSKAVNPDAIEVCDDGIDNNCDGNTDCNDSVCMDELVCDSRIVSTTDYSNGFGIHHSGSYLFCFRKLSPTSLSLDSIDISVPENPVLKSSIQSDNQDVYDDLYLFKNGLAFSAHNDTGEGLHIYDIRDPLNLKKVDKPGTYCETSPFDNVYSIGSYVFSGCNTLDISDPDNIALLSHDPSFHPSVSPNQDTIAIRGDRAIAYIVDGGALYNFYVTDPLDPNQIGFQSGGNYDTLIKVAILDPFIYIINQPPSGPNELLIEEFISYDELFPSGRGLANTTGAKKVVPFGSFAFLATDIGLDIIDIDESQYYLYRDPFLVETIGIGNALSLDVQDNYAFVTTDDKLYVISLDWLADL